MLGISRPSEKKVWGVALITGVIMLVVVAGVIMLMRHNKEPLTLADATKSTPIITTPSDEHIKQVKQYAESKASPKNRMDAYIAVGNAYYMKSDYKDALDGFGAAMSLADQGGMSTGQRTSIQNLMDYCKLVLAQKPTRGPASIPDDAGQN